MNRSAELKNLFALLNKEHNTTTYVILNYLTLLFILCSSIIFPFYVYLNKVNRSRDESVSIFPITNHLYKIMKVTFLLMFVSNICFYCGRYFDESLLLVFFALSCVLSINALDIITQVAQLMISLLAIRKFITYFLPSSIQTVIKIQNWLFSKSWMFYVGFIIKDLVALIISFRELHSGSDDNFRFGIISYISLNTFHIASALLYVPIAIRMKHRETMSLKKNKPQRYIVWQTLLIMVFKIISTILAILLYFLEVVSIDTILRALYFFDATSTPLIVQISYLFNNKKSLKTLLLNFKFANFIRVLLNIEVKSAVLPEANEIAMVQKAGSSEGVETGKGIAVIDVPGSTGKDVEDRL
ncbi:hypothetical protein CAEBREN_06573 [Caenorhabditis brenneri]|uniref:Serpentine Receptor, class Z n=1 Tax=Caenorhabditis brenneri TaxID=135651 RepID=G0PAU7_CAEBE|nr:hypothetical protein CAEBREN_06573 [Caenorhabditis brenneri]